MTDLERYNMHAAEAERREHPATKRASAMIDALKKAESKVHDAQRAFEEAESNVKRALVAAEKANAPVALWENWWRMSYGMPPRE